MSRPDPSPLRLASAGVGAVGTAFGMARYGYGLLLPAIQHTYGLGVTALGAIGAGSYASYLVAAAISGGRAHVIGPRGTVVSGGLMAALGMVIAGLSRDPGMLAAGVLVGGASCGIVYPPFADAVSRLGPGVRERTLSAINCGTGYGVAVASPLAILAGAEWRAAWLAFAACALASTAWAAHVLPPRNAPRIPAAGNADEPHADQPPSAGAVAELPGARRIAPLIASAAVIGLGSAAYWTFAVDHLQRDGGLGVGPSRAFLGVVGVASLLSTATGDLSARFGARRVFAVAVGAEAAGLVLLALDPASLTAALASAVLFGASYNAVVAISALWSSYLYPQRPSLGLAVAMAANAAGLLCGPVAAGALGETVGLTDVLLGGAVIVAAATLLGPPAALVPRRPRLRRSRAGCAGA